MGAPPGTYMMPPHAVMLHRCPACHRASSNTPSSLTHPPNHPPTPQDQHPLASAAPPPPQCGGIRSKADKDWTRRIGTERHLICIEDPFDLSHNLVRTIDRGACQILRREFERATSIWASEQDPLPRLLEPFRTVSQQAAAAQAQQQQVPAG